MGTGHMTESASCTNKDYIPRCPRYPAKFYATLYGKEGGPIWGQAKNISLTGILLVPDKYGAPILPGDDMRLEVYISESGTFKFYRIPLRVARLTQTEAGMTVDASDEKAQKALCSILLHATKEKYAD